MRERGEKVVEVVLEVGGGKVGRVMQREENVGKEIFWQGSYFDTDQPLLIHGAQGSKEQNIGNPLVLPSGPIIRSRSKRYEASMSLYVQEQVTKELHDLAFNKCYVELEGTPKFLTLLEACIEDGSTIVLSSTHCPC
ncbi:hypothetical protein JCGZ_24005 [Jatropha curcas]|uniref:Uncharacterized protein n=1 Tax=Jatropha curcas TaxID=180498 RepID=A0A067K1S1_JATCU|nr:hypothetical protein JCGZ_24005 [Jatropha curcas]